MQIDVDLITIVGGLILNAVTIIGILTKSSVRLESRITRLETSLAFVLHLMKVNVAQHERKDEGG